MKKFNVNSLKTITPPPPADEAKDKALTQGLKAFKEAQAEKNIKTCQGKSNNTRLTYSFSQKLWRQMMKKYFMAGVAISGLAAAGFVFIAYNKTEAPLQTAPLEASKDFAAETQQIQGTSTTPTLASPLASGYGNKATRSKLSVSDDILLSESDMVLGEYEIADVEEAPLGFSGYTYRSPEKEDESQFSEITPNSVKQVSLEPVSTFSIDVDTSAYSHMRSSLNSGYLPHPNAIRTEELINYFDYDYPLPQTAAQPFKPSIALYPTPWNKETKLLHIGIKGHDVMPTEKPRANLVFLVDTSGSMDAENKLGLLKKAFTMMVENLEPQDTISLVAYAGSAGIVLEPTKVQEKTKILTALERLSAGGSTAGGEGIKLAYRLAEENFDDKAVNRVILASDGDFNVGISSPDELKKYIEQKRQTGIFLSVLGFGQDNYNDALMQALAQNGNGNAAYIDTLGEARKVLVEEASSTLFSIAKDVKIQIEFNPHKIAEYRLIGYETRALKREDFNNDKVDAGDIGSGHSVTAIYEITPVGSQAQMIDSLRYQKNTDATALSDNETFLDEEYGFLKIRYKLPTEDKSRLIEYAITANDESKNIDDTNDDIRFSTAVAAFAQLLRGETFIKDFTYDDVLKLAQSGKGDDIFGYRSEFINLVKLAKSLNQ